MKIFLSSTCYDLVDLRAIIEDYFLKKGEELLLSDRNTFPVDPDEHRHDLCLLNAKNADLFLLFLDKRFGASYYKDNNISITWAEYRAAKEANIPILVFIRENVFNERETWKKNGRQDNFKPAFTDKTDTFKFIDEIQLDNKGFWIEPFRNAVDILKRFDNSDFTKVNVPKKSLEYIKNIIFEIIKEVQFGLITSVIR
jgi:Domain of unknown function (DUF4062)